jgi:hypothetical protein
MNSMTRTGRSTVSVLLAALALAAMLPVPCVCLPEAAPAQTHDCCAGTYAFSAQAPGCCPAAAEPGKTTPAAPPDAPALVPVLAFASALVFDTPGRPLVRALAVAPLASPPSTVRRL